MPVEAIKRKCFTGLCCCVLTAITAQMLGALIFVLMRAEHASPAICQEGRLASAEARNHFRVAIDVPKSDGVLDLECLVPIAVYNHGQLHRSPRDNLRQVGVLGPLAVPFVEKKLSGVKCLSQNASAFAHLNNLMGLQFYKQCDDQWDCNHGKCTVFEKALRMCLSRVAPEAYECTYVPGKPEWGVTTTAKQTMQEVFLFISFAAFFCLSVLFVIWDGGEEATSSSNFLTVKFDASCAYWAAAMVIFGTFFTHFFFQAFSRKLPLPLLRSAADLRGPCTSGEWYMCGTPQIEAIPWNRFMDSRSYYLMWDLLFTIWLLGPPCLLVSMCLFPSQQGEANERTPLV